MLTNLGKTYQECVRILKITTKPTPLQFRKIIKITGGAILLVGTLGIIIHLIFSAI
jgi:preprotein translocase subunit Sss1